MGWAAHTVDVMADVEGRFDPINVVSNHDEQKFRTNHLWSVALEFFFSSLHRVQLASQWELRTFARIEQVIATMVGRWQGLSTI